MISYKKRRHYKYSLHKDYEIHADIEVEEPKDLGFVKITNEGLLLIRKNYAWFTGA